MVHPNHPNGQQHPEIIHMTMHNQVRKSFAISQVAHMASLPVFLLISHKSVLSCSPSTYPATRPKNINRTVISH
jgi:hypothetical protein